MLVQLVTAKTLALLETYRSGDSRIEEDVEEIVRRGLDIARSATPENNDLTAAQIDLELRSGNLLQLFSLIRRIGDDSGPEGGSPYLLAWRAAALSVSRSKTKIDEAELLLAEARESSDRSLQFDERLRSTLDFVDNLVQEARARIVE